MTLEQKKLIACAELDGWIRFDLQPNPMFGFVGIGNMIVMHKRLHEFNYDTSLDAIVPVVVKWCGEDNERKAKFQNNLVIVVYPKFFAPYGHPEIGSKIMWLMLTATASQILDALLLAAGKIPKE